MSKFNIYTASAGSGKTFQLTRHYLELLLREPDNYKKILAVTFTNKAAGELKERVVKELVNIAKNGPDNSGHFQYLSSALNREEDLLRKRAVLVLRNILQDYGHFSIGTIDHFFQKVLRSFSKEAGIHNGYKLELNSDTFLTGSVELLMNDLGQDPALLKWLARWVDFKISRDESWARIEKDLKSIGFEFLREQLLEAMTDEWIEKFNEESVLSLEKLISSIESSFEKALKETADRTRDFLHSRGLDAAIFKGGASRSIPAYLLAAKNDPAYLKRKRHEAAVDNPEEWYNKTSSEGTRNMIISALDDGLREILRRHIEYLEENEPLYNTASLIRQNLFSLGITGKLVNYINRYSDQTNSLLINLTSPILARIIGTNPSPFIYEKVGTYYNHFMIDEFQDTSSLQWKNFLPLIRNSLAEDDFSMVVGDVKQSIFRWRNSNWKLMAEEAREDLKNFGIDDRKLDKNWRSRDSIIEFNNKFFEKAAGRLVERVNEDIKEYRGGVQLRPGILKDIYDGATQDNGMGKPGGYVELALQGAEEDETWEKRIPQLVVELQEKYNYKPEDITFLVRKNKQVKSIINLLQQYRESNPISENCSFDIVSSESYELQNSSSVRCIIWALRYILEPEEGYFRARLAQEYISLKRKYLSEIEYSNIIQLKDDPDIFEKLVPPELVKNQKLYAYSSGALLIEEIIRIFQLQGDMDEMPYLLAFRDQVLSGIGGSGSLEEISAWWDELGYKVSVPMTEQSGAMRVMTIHKSKGLEFKVVIMPYCDWEMGNVQNGHIMWVDTAGSPFSQVPVLPLMYGSQLANSIFPSVYYNEKIQIYLDNLNLVYVAFTRAEDRLYAFCPTKSRGGSYPVSQLISEVLGLDADTELKYVLGNPNTVPSGSGDKKEIRRFALKSFQADPYTGVSGLRRAFESHAIRHGKVMHEVLEKTLTLDDLRTAIQELKSVGKLTEDQGKDVFIHLTGLLGRSDLNDWYSGKYKVYREKSIIVPGKGEFRPDRIMEGRDEMIILDYKFGEERPSHEKQVMAYQEAFRGMTNKHVRAFLLYPETGLLKEAGRTT